MIKARESYGETKILRRGVSVEQRGQATGIG